MPLLDLSRVETACRKPGCTASGGLHRHHKRHQKLFVRHFYGRKGSRYEKFVRRYESFHPKDVVLICPEHHQEIHDLYRRIIRRHARRVGLPLWAWSWKQANKLMDAMEEACDQWLRYTSPGRPWRHYQAD